MKQQKYTGMQKFQANSLENNIGGFTDPELWEATKKIYGGVTEENQHRCWLDYWKAMGEKGTWRSGHFETEHEYVNEDVKKLIYIDFVCHKCGREDSDKPNSYKVERLMCEECCFEELG